MAVEAAAALEEEAKVKAVAATATVAALVCPWASSDGVAVARAAVAAEPSSISAAVGMGHSATRDH